MLTSLNFDSRHKMDKWERKAANYAPFSDPKWFKAHNVLSEILATLIPRKVAKMKYGLGSEGLSNAIKEYKKDT